MTWIARRKGRAIRGSSLWPTIPLARRQFQGNTTLAHLLVQAPQHDVHDLDVLHSQCVEHHSFVDTIEKFRVGFLSSFMTLFIRERHFLSVMLEPNSRILLNRAGARFES